MNPPRIAILGDEKPRYPSHVELNAARVQLGDMGVDSEWVPTDSETAADLSGFDALWLAPGSPYRDDDAVFRAISWARTNDVPFLGVCGGLQYAVIEFLRNVVGDGSASHAEVDGVSDDNAVTPLACSLFGEEREVRPVPGTRFADLVGGSPFIGMHYCNYGPTPEALARVTERGMVVEATALDAPVEVLELPTNRFYLLTLFQPQVGASASVPLHPVLREFAEQARAHREVVGRPS